MNYIKGKLKKLIFYSKESGFVVALFRVRETNVASIGSNKTITVTGSFLDPSIDIPMALYGDYKKNDKWGMQFVVESYEVDKPTTKEAIIDFLSSPFIEGCGEVTAKRIVETFGEKSLDIIKNDKENSHTPVSVADNRLPYCSRYRFQHQACRPGLQGYGIDYQGQYRPWLHQPERSTPLTER